MIAIYLLIFIWKNLDVMRCCLLGIFCLIGMGAPVKGADSLREGVVIHHSPSNSGRYVGSPSIVVMPDGTYIASHDYFGHFLSDTFVYRSDDKGLTWERISTLKTLTWATLFNKGKELYLIGIRPRCTMGYGDFVVCRSDDNGKTWTTPQDENTGLIRKGFYHCAPVPVVKRDGKYWRAMENMGKDGGWGPFAALMTSIACDGDLLNANEWILSNELMFQPSWKEGAVAWLEGNAVADKKGDIKDILRVADRQDDVAAMASVSPDGRTLSFDPSTDFIHLPGAAKKFTIRYDRKSKKYWALTNYALSDDRLALSDFGSIRNTQVLICSSDLYNWQIVDTVLTCMRPDYYGYQYVDWQIDGKDIVFVSRTAWQDEYGLPPRQHDANYLTFHRLKHFRRLADKQCK